MPRQITRLAKVLGRTQTDGGGVAASSGVRFRLLARPAVAAGGLTLACIAFAAVAAKADPPAADSPAAKPASDKAADAKGAGF